MDELTRRAAVAFLKAAPNPQPAEALSGVETVGGRDYVVLRNVDATLAVYRVKTDGRLKRMKRWPEQIK